MKELTQQTVNFFERQSFVMVSTFDSDHRIHSAAKGIVSIESKGIINLIDVFKGITCANIKKNGVISISAIDEHAYIGYTLQGEARIVEGRKIPNPILLLWEEKVTKRITQRFIKNVQADRKSIHYHEANFPTPQCLIIMKVEEIIDLSLPPQMRKLLK